MKQTNTSDGKYILFTPDLNSNFEYWGLSLKKVEYYIDGSFYKTETSRPFELMINKENFSIGMHNIKVVLLIVSETCEDIILEKSTEFQIRSNETEYNISPGDFYIDYNRVIQGDYLVITPELLVESSSKGCKIDKVEYYWDEKLIATEKTMPFTLKYKVNDNIGTSHNIKVSIYYHDDKNDFLIYNWGFIGYKVYSDDDALMSWSIKSTRNNYKNNGLLSLVAKQIKGKKSKKQFIIEFYLDGHLIGHSSDFPYILDYKLSGLKVGSHIVTAKSTTQEGGATITYSTDKTIVITE